MDKFEVAKYGMMQVVALAYAILICGTATKFYRMGAEIAGRTLPDFYYYAAFMRDYGAIYFLMIIAWAGFAGYHSNSPDGTDSAPWWAQAAIASSIVLAFGSTVIAFVALSRSLS